MKIQNIYFSWLAFRIMILGFISGLFLPITGSILSAQLWSMGINISTISLFSLIALPYSLKFIWAPLVDIYYPQKRKVWIIGCQTIIAVMLVVLGFSENLTIIGVCSLIISFFSATQDIAIDTLRIESFSDKDQGVGVFLTTLGYRVGMLIGGIVPLIIANHHSWFLAYVALIVIMIPGIITTYLYPEHEKQLPTQASRPSYGGLLYQNLRSIFSTRNQISIVIFIILYKLSDAYLGSITIVFLLEHQFSLSQIAGIVKTFGLACTLIGMFIGSELYKRFSNRKMLVCGLIMQSLSNLFFLLIEYNPGQVYILTLVMSIENLAGGISSAIFVSYISKICNRNFLASQYALLSSLSSVSRVFLSSSAGYVATILGWQSFIILSSLMSLMALFILYSKTQKILY